MLDDRRLGPVTIGWITPADLADPHATTIRLTHETQPLPGHQSLHRPEEDAVVKAGYDAAEGADRSSGEAVEDAYPSADAGSDAPAKPRASFLWELGNSLNPISTAKAAGPEEDERGFEEFLDPLAPVRIERWNYLRARLSEIEPWNRFFDAVETSDYVPTEKDIRAAEEALDEAITRRDPPAARPADQPLAAASPLFRGPPDGSPYDVIVNFRMASELADFMRRGGASEPEIAAAVERFLLEQTNQGHRNQTLPKLSDFEKDIEESIKEKLILEGDLFVLQNSPAR